MTIVRGQIPYTDADASEAIAGLGIALAGETESTELAASVLERYQTRYLPCSVARNVPFDVEGIEAADQLVSAVRVVYAQVSGALAFENVTADTTLFDNYVTFTGVDFGPDDFLIIAFIDVTRPDAEEL